MILACLLEFMCCKVNPLSQILIGFEVDAFGDGRLDKTMKKKTHDGTVMVV